MITERETSRYEVCPQKIIESSFSGAYDSASDAPVITKPDLAVTVTSCLSMLIIFGMCVLTGVHLKNNIIWYIIGVIFLLVPFYIIYKHIKKSAEYKKANSVGAKRFDYKAEYLSIFPQDLPEKMPASEMAREIAYLQGKQKRDMYNNAIRDLISTLNATNNPNDIMCKNLTVYGSIMNQIKKRYYIKSEEGKIIIYDADFMNPRGELVCDSGDIISFGSVSEYPGLKASGAKVSQDATVIEIKTGDTEKDRLYLEVHGKEYERLKKLLGGKKEL